MAIINLGPQDVQLGFNVALPGANANVLTGIIDIQAIAPNSNAWRLGRFVITVPAIPENLAGAGITIALQAAPPSLVAGASAIAPLTPPPGVFVTPTTSQTATIPPVAVVGSAAQVAYMTLAFDPTGSVYQFYQFLITVPAGVAAAEQISIAWEFA
jgi:hypothetical protein